MSQEKRKQKDDRFRPTKKESEELLIKLKESSDDDDEIKKIREDIIRIFAYEIYKVRLKYNLIGDSKTDWFISESFTSLVIKEELNDQI